MQREEKSERSKRLVLDTALDLFSRQGYRATTIRDIADAAGVSTGNVYHHFSDKEAIFTTLLDELIALSDTRRFPFRRALMSGRFPDNLEELGIAARDSVREFRQHFILIYVDVIEFGGAHMQRFFAELTQRLAEELSANGHNRISPRLRSGVSPATALMLTTRMFFSYFTQEILFNAPAPADQEPAQVVREIADMLRNGIIE